jgi:Flp pilus assembly protein TadG
MVGKSASLARRQGKALAGFRRDRRGAVSPILALALIPIIFTMGFATEMSSWWLMQRSLQHAADSAALVAATDAGNYPSPNTCSGYACSAPASPVNCSQATTDPDHSWYCQAIAAAAKYGYVNGMNTVTVTPQADTCSNLGVNLSSGFSNNWCYKVTVTKDIPVFLLGIMGFRGTTTIAGVNYQQIGAHALASVPGPPIKFCMLTTDGDIVGKGTPKADLLGCDTFSNGNTSCVGNGLQAGESFASGTSSSKDCTINGKGLAPADQQYQCDPYGATTQTFPYNDGTQGTFTETCSGALNVSGAIPPAPKNCGSSVATTNNNNDGTSSFPSSNVITQASLNGTASGFNAASNATTMTIGGVSMQVIQVCGTAMLTTTPPTASTGNPPTCGNALTYTGASSNLAIIIYDGGLDMNGCTLASSTPTSTGGGMTVIFAPAPTVAGGATLSTSCDMTGGKSAGGCYPLSTNGANSGGTLQVGAPTSGPFTGLSIAQSANYAPDSGCGNGKSGVHSGPIDWCRAGNQPTLDLQGLIYMPEAELSFAGAISKFQPNSLNCTGWIIKAFSTNGTGAVLDNNPLTGWPSSITSQCSQAGAILPGVPHTHTYYQALVG